MYVRYLGLLKKPIVKVNVVKYRQTLMLKRNISLMNISWHRPIQRKELLFVEKNYDFDVNYLKSDHLKL